jgi:hypothetical protein
MTRWSITAGLVLLLAVLYVACQGKTTKDPAVERGESIRPDEAVVVQPADRIEEDPVPQEKKEREEAKKATEEPVKKEKPAPGPKGDEAFAKNAFPPTVSDTDYHKDAWYKDDCLRCHETGVEKATRIQHKDLPAILLTAKCRSCHVLIPGSSPVKPKPTKEESLFAANAFPPMIPASNSHREAWSNDNCLLCHEDGVKGAPIVKHKNLPKVLLTAKCRSCHVQVRSASVPGR